MNFRHWLTRYYKKCVTSEETKRKPRDERVKFSISTPNHFNYMHDMKGYIKSSANINGLNFHSFFMSLTREPIVLTTAAAYATDKVPIKEAKIKDLKKILQYIPDDYKEFYSEILTWPTVADSNNTL